MLEFLIQLWQTTILQDAQKPLICLPQSLEAIVTHFSLPVTRLSNSATSFLKELESALVATQPDRLLLIPPLVAHEELPQSLRAKHPPQTNLHDLALQCILNHAPTGCLVGAWLPLGFFLASGHAPLRQTLLDHHRLRLIVETACDIERFNLPDYNAARRMHTLVFQIGRAGDERVRLFTCPDIPQRVEADGSTTADSERQSAVLQDLHGLLKSQGKPSTFGLVLQKPPSMDSAWLPGWHRQDFQKSVQELSAYGVLKPLGDLFYVLRGFQTSEQVNFLVNAANTQRGIPVIEEVNILPDNSFNFSETRHRALSKATAAYHLQPNDICLRQSLGSDERLRAVKITPEVLPLAAHESVFILRPKASIAVDADLVTAYLRSGRVTQFLRAQGVADRLYRQSLAEVLVPSEDEELKDALFDIRTAADALQQWRADADTAVDTLFADKPVQQARRDFLVAGRTLRQRERAARQIDNFSYRLRTGLPYPLAYRWRMVETAQADYEAYKNLLETAEVIACYLANLALMITRHLKFDLPCLAEMAVKLSDPALKHGTSFGDWVNILRQFNQSNTMKQAGNFPFFEIARLLDNADTNSALQRLSNERNDEAHGRGPKGPQVLQRFNEVRIDLGRFISATEFLTEYPLRYIVDTKVDSLTGLTTYGYQDLMGDHPLVAIHSAETNLPHVEKGSLYAVDRAGTLHLLRPYFTRQQLEDGRWGIFSLDKFDHAARNCSLKCLESSTTQDAPELFRAFQYVGLYQ